MNQGWTYCDRIGPESAGLTVLEYYRSRYRHSGDHEWQARIETGQVLLDDRSTSPTELLRSAQVLTYCRPPWQEPAAPLDIAVIYADEQVLVVAKPGGLPVLPGGGFLEHTLLWQVRRRFAGEQPPVPIHRLGRGTSGLLLLARTHASRAALSEQMRRQRIGKLYRALASGTGMLDRFTVRQPIGKVPHPLLGTLWAAAADGLPARSDCVVLRRRCTDSLLAVAISTGRPHQIRIHLAAAGYPLIGDPLFGPGGVARLDNGASVPGDGGYFLHAHRLSFLHPTSGRRLVLECPPPPELT
ncbi:pseudouridine synthase [Gloeobacter morelensis]|uniref:RNA pseudouridylate synthase n=1 Tax=Gloeobacter morelensis MG652769 TaxID=2781736 RepID=A0ABY3PQ56_9CYAN|nr:pseudouridine synthase [Gloeobacter morelensis]UFP95837.1 RNA pseudouridine synthase [Gloeobacter morelensis MG652769]